MVMSTYTIEYKNPVIYNPEDRCVYEDNPTQRLGEGYEYGEPIFNARRFAEVKKEQNSSDPLKITDVFYGKHGDTAKDYYSKLNKVRETKDKSLAAAIISSKEYPLLQTSVVLGTNEENIKTGILVSQFEEVTLNQLSGKYASFAHDLKWFTNLGEGDKIEPSFGGYSETTISIPKSGASVAITERARQLINGADVYSRLVNQLGIIRLQKENEQTATEIESNTSLSITGVDWGARSSGVSSNNPLDKFNEFQTTFSTKSAPANLFISKWLGFAELYQNDFIKGTGQPLLPISGAKFGETTGNFPILNGIKYVADDAISSATAGWLMASQAIKIFRGPSRAYTVTDPDAETERYVTKVHFKPKTVQPELIYRVTGITA